MEFDSVDIAISAIVFDGIQFFLRTDDLADPWVRQDTQILCKPIGSYPDLSR